MTPHKSASIQATNETETTASASATEVTATVVTTVVALVPSEILAPVAAESGFAHFGLPSKLMQALNRIKFTTPTPDSDGSHSIGSVR